MIRIALVEDEAEVRAQLQGYVQRHTRQYGTEFAVTEFADGMELLDDYRPSCRNRRYHLVYAEEKRISS